MHCMMGSIQFAALSCSLLALLLYLNTLDCDLVFDDTAAISSNKDVRPESPWSNLLYHDFWGDDLHHPKSHKSFRPLTSATFKANYHIHQEHSYGYHLVNVLLNAIVCYLFVLVCGGVFFGEVWPSFLAGLLYTVHPLHTEAVAGVVGRAELLASIFFLLALLSYKRAIDSKCASWRWLLTSMFLSVCSLLSKEQGITVIAVCLAYEFFLILKVDAQGIKKMLKPTKIGHFPKLHKRFLARLLALSVFLIPVLVVRVQIMYGGPKYSKIDNPGQHLTTPLRQLYFLHLCFINAWLFLNPSKLRHDWRDGPIPIFQHSTDPRTLLTLLTFIGLVLLGLNCTMKKGNHMKSVAFALSFIVITFIPSSNLFHFVGFVVAERILYLPSMGACILVASGAYMMIKSATNRHYKILTRCGLVYLLLFHSIKTLHRNTVWYSSHNLYVDALKLYPADGLMFSNLGYDFRQRNMTSLAEECHIMAVKLAPNFSQPFRNYGNLLKNEGRYGEAEKMFRRAVQILGSVPRSKRSRRAQTYHALAEVISKNESRLQEAISVLNTVIEIEPDELYSYIFRGKLLLQQNRAREALSMYKTVLKYQPDSQELLYNMGEICLMMTDTVCAERYFKNIIEINPTHGYALLKYATLIAQKKTATSEELVAAHKYLHMVIKADSNFTEAHYSLGLIYLRLNRVSDAHESLERAHAMNPSHSETIKTLARIYYTQKNYPKTVEVLNLLPEGILLLRDNSEILAALGNSYWYLGQHKKTERMYERVLQHDSEHMTAMKSLGKIWMIQKNYEEAKKMFQRVQELNATDEFAREHLNKIEIYQRS